MLPRYLRHALTLGLALSCCLLFVSRSALASATGLELDRWDGLLNAAVTDGQVNYALWRDNPDFDGLVEQIATADLSGLDRQQRLAFYINSYNILAAAGILAGQSPDSLLGRFTYFRRTQYTIAGEAMSLHALEHEVIRPLGEPRIHFAIVCASHSCPKLRGEAYRADRLDQQLDDAARGFINDATRNRFEVETATAQLSMIFKWFAEDFEQQGTLQSYLAPYVDNPAAAQLLRSNGFAITHQTYLWHRNGTL